MSLAGTGTFETNSVFGSGEQRYALHSSGFDRAGNLYLTGTSRDLNHYRVMTASLGPDGDVRWIRYAGGTSEADDAAAAIAVDVAGNSYVAATLASNGFQRAVILAYGPAGTERWRHDLGGTWADSAQGVGVAVRAEGGVVALTNHWLSGSTTEPLVVAYDSSGAELWRAAGSGIDGVPAFPWELALDARGNVYVGGTAYAPEGALIWVRSWRATGESQWLYAERPAEITDGVFEAMRVTGEGSVYLAADGSLGGRTAIVTSRLDARGELMWSRVSGREGSGDDRASALSVDASGSVAVVGNRRLVQNRLLTLVYREDGAPLWRVEEKSGEIGWVANLDVTSNLLGGFDVVGLAAGGSGPEAVLTRYDDGGVARWRWTMPEAFANGRVAHLWPGTGGRVLLATSCGPATLGGFLTLDFTNQGEVAWSSCVHGSADRIESANAVGVDAVGNVYAAGWTRTFEELEWLIASFDPFGRERWQVVRSNGSGDYSVANDIAVRPDGVSFVVGYEGLAPGAQDFKVIALSPAGRLLWERASNGDGMLHGNAIKVRLDDEGNVYAFGESWTTSERVLRLVSFDAAGTMRWQVTGPVGAYTSATPTDMVVSASGDVCVTGGGLLNLVVACFDSMGEARWSRAYSDPGGERAWSWRIREDPSANVFVAGTIGEGTGKDLLILSYDPDGVFRWATRVEGPSGDRDVATALVVDHASRAFVAGYMWSATSYDTVLAGLGPNGAVDWLSSFAGADGGYDWPYDAELDSEGNLYVMGYGYHAATGSDPFVLSFRPDGTERWSSFPEVAGEQRIAAGRVAGVDRVAMAGMGFAAGPDLLATWYGLSAGVFADGFESGDTSKWSE